MEGGTERPVDTGLSDTFDFGGRPRFRGLASSTATKLAGKKLMEIAMKYARGRIGCSFKRTFIRHDSRIVADILGSTPLDAARAGLCNAGRRYRMS
jgi:hypothetical protein